MKFLAFGESIFCIVAWDDELWFARPNYPVDDWNTPRYKIYTQNNPYLRGLPDVEWIVRGIRRRGKGWRVVSFPSPLQDCAQKWERCCNHQHNPLAQPVSLWSHHTLGQVTFGSCLARKAGERDNGVERDRKESSDPTKSSARSNMPSHEVHVQHLFVHNLARLSVKVRREPKKKFLFLFLCTWLLRLSSFLIVMSWFGFILFCLSLFSKVASEAQQETIAIVCYCFASPSIHLISFSIYTHLPLSNPFPARMSACLFWNTITSFPFLYCFHFIISLFSITDQNKAILPVGLILHFGCFENKYLRSLLILN